MRAGLRLAIRIAAIAVTAMVAACAQALADTAGTVHFERSADSSFDQFTSSPSPQAQAWLRAHMWRMLVWSPYFDERTSWYAQGWMYDDSYAIYRESTLASQHPEWILKDSSGNRLYIPYGCANGTCPQYAGDVSNPAFRHYWIEQARAHMAHGYRGLFVDDVNMEERVGNASESLVTPVGLGGAIAPARWRAYMAEFMSEIRAAFPSSEIVHNAIWFANGDAGSSDPSIRREIEAANYIMLERGVNDSGITGGNGPWSLNAMLSFIDEVHSLGRGIVLDGAATDPQGMEYNLASYFLISGGNDAVSSAGQTPSDWWPGFEVNLGEAAGARHAWDGLLRRDFSDGMALVNPPGSTAQSVQLPAPMRTASGATVSSVTLPPASGAVLLGAPPASSPAQTASETNTQTTLEAHVIHYPSHNSGPGSRERARNTGAGGSARPHSRSRRHRHRAGRAHAARRLRPRLRRSPSRRSLLTRIAGRVRHATRGSVLVRIDRRSRGRWITVGRVSLGVSSAGRFLSLIRLAAGARYRVSATYTGASGYRPSWSGYRLIAPRGA